MDKRDKKLGTKFSFTLLNMFVIWNLPVRICRCIVPINTDKIKLNKTIMANIAR